MEEMMSISEEEIKRYYELNAKQKEMKQEMDHLKKKFHEVLDASFGKQTKGEIQRGNYKVQRQLRTATTYDDAGTVNKLDDLNLQEFIIETRVADTEKLESAIKIGLVEEADFRDFKKTKVTQTIVVKQTFTQ